MCNESDGTTTASWPGLERGDSEWPGIAYGAEEDPREIDEKAMAVLTRMAETLAQAKQFSFRADIGFDVVQDAGLKIEFGETRQALFRRPDHLRIDTTKRDKSKTRFVFDGQHISVFNDKENVYASVAKSGTVDEMIAYFTNDLDMRLPLAEFFSANLSTIFEARVDTAYYVAEPEIGGVACDHVAIRTIEADVQMWVAKKGQPLPQRIVITYRKAVGQPQFRALFSDWDLAPDLTDAQFAFTPPKDAVQINIVPRQRRFVGTQETPGGTQ